MAQRQVDARDLAHHGGQVKDRDGLTGADDSIACRADDENNALPSPTISG